MRTKKLLSCFLVVLLLFAAALPAFASQNDRSYKNVIIMIGDGMGENHLHLAEEYGHTLFMNTQYDLRGQSKTRSLSHLTTDSAAGGTALSCGVKVINQTLGVFGYDPLGLFTRPVSITEAAARRGMRTGIVTTDQTSGATPASFSVHVLYRKQNEKISQQQLESEFDLIWGAAESAVTPEAAEAHGFAYVTNRDEMFALTPGTRSFGQFSSECWHAEMNPEDGNPSLAEMSMKAIELLNEGNDKGFFLMIEGAHIDKRSHKSDGLKKDYDSKREETVDAVVGFDNAIRDVADFARRDGHTVVLVTADHETGNLYFDRGRYRFHSDEHTCKNVPVFVFGAADLFSPGEAVENCSIPRRLTALLGWSEEEFPATQAGPFLKRLRAALQGVTK